MGSQARAGWSLVRSQSRGEEGRGVNLNSINQSSILCRPCLPNETEPLPSKRMSIVHGLWMSTLKLYQVWSHIFPFTKPGNLRWQTSPSSQSESEETKRACVIYWCRVIVPSKTWELWRLIKLETHYWDCLSDRNIQPGWLIWYLTSHNLLTSYSLTLS